MKTYGCSGTIGDTYINLCILYHVAKIEHILCRHHTDNKKWQGLIRQIYSLMPNIRVEFVDKPDTINPRIYSAFTPHKKFGKILSSPDDWCVFPNFVFPKVSDLPEHYVVLNPRSGRPDQKRILTEKIIDTTIKNSCYPVVVLGTSETAKKIKGDNVINLTNKTSLLEALGVVSMAQHVTTFQGIISIMAVSQRIQSSVYIRHILDSPSYSERIVPEWAPYHHVQEEEL
jgi:hypothetical protein